MRGRVNRVAVVLSFVAGMTLSHNALAQMAATPAPNIPALYGARATTQRVQYDYTGVDRRISAPANAVGVYFKVWGGGGGRESVLGASKAGAGGFTSAVFDTTPGTQYALVVGGGGNRDAKPGGNDTGPLSPSQVGVYGFGGAGAHDQGGGLSGVFADAAQVTRTSQARALVVAGGGGGGDDSGATFVRAGGTNGNGALSGYGTIPGTLTWGYTSGSSTGRTAGSTISGTMQGSNDGYTVPANGAGCSNGEYPINWQSAGGGGYEGGGRTAYTFDGGGFAERCGSDTAGSGRGGSGFVAAGNRFQSIESSGQIAEADDDSVNVAPRHGTDTDQSDTTGQTRPAVPIGRAGNRTETFDSNVNGGGDGRIVVYWILATPTVAVQKITSNGVGGAFAFEDTNLTGSFSDITTTAANTATPTAPVGLPVTDASRDVTILELAAPGFVTAGIVCNDANSAATGNTNPVASSATSEVTIPAAALNQKMADITCRFTNARPATITVTLDAVPDDAQDFAFTTTGAGLTNFSLDDDGNAPLPNTRSFTGLTPGAFTVTETAVPGWELTNLVCADPDGGSTVDIGSGVATIDLDAGETVACTYTNAKRSTIRVTKVSTGGVGTFSFSGTNGVASHSITTDTSGVGVSGTTQTLRTNGTATTITESAPPDGFALTGINCTGLGAGGTQTPTINGTGGGSVVLDAAATAAGSAIECTFTNSGAGATVRITKVSNGGVGTFEFFGGNGVASQNITTTTPGVGVSGTVQALNTAATETEIFEGLPPAGFVLTAINCTGLGAGGTQTPRINGRNGGSVVLNAAATAAGSAIECTFTNARLPTIRITKVSTGGTGTFTFTGTNGFFPSHSITTTTPGVGTSGATRTLAAVDTATTITESMLPNGFALQSINCTGLGAGGRQTPTINGIRGGNVVLDAAAVAAGSVIECSFINTRQSTIRVTKVSNDGVGTFGFSGTNGVANHSITTATPGVGVAGATQVLTRVATATTITESAPPAGFALTGITCTGLGAGGTQTPTINGASGGSVALNAAATAVGSAIECTFTNSRQGSASIRVTKVSTGGVGSFGFSGTNGIASHTITTVTPGVGVAGTTQLLTAAGTATTITEGAPPPGFALTGINCTGLGAGGTQTPTINGASGGNVVLNAAATANGSAIECTFTNAAQVDLSITKTNTPGINGNIDPANDAVASGGTTTYQIRVVNNGPGAVTGAVVTDAPGAGITCPDTNAVTITGDGVPASRFTVVDLRTGIALGRLASGQTAILSFSCTVRS